MCRRAAAFTATFLLLSALNLQAADRVVAPDATATPIRAAAARAVTEAEPGMNLWTLSQTPRRPGALTTLYGTYATLQALDVISTRRALSAGATEQNPLMKSGRMGAMVAVKAAAGVSTIYFAEKLWKKNRLGAIVVMAALNGAQAAVVAHNTRNVRR
jgi:hypothetical protein